MKSKNASGKEVPDIEWRDPPPKIVGRKPADRADAIMAGKNLRTRLEADRRARGIPRQGKVLPGERPDQTYTYDEDGKRVRAAD